MNDKTFYLNGNLRSISAIIAARNKQENLQKLPTFGGSRRQSKISKQSVNVIRIRRSSFPLNHNSKKASLQPNNNAKTCLWRSSKIVPYNNNVFDFDNKSDLTITDILSNRCRLTQEDHRNLEKKKTKRKCIIICLFATFVIIIATTIVVIFLLIPSKK